MRRGHCAILAVIVLASGADVRAHGLAAAFVSIETADDHEADVLVKLPEIEGNTPELRVRFADGCKELTSPTRFRRKDGVIHRWTIRCEQPLTGMEIELVGLNAILGEAFVEFRSPNADGWNTVVRRALANYTPRRRRHTRPREQCRLLSARHRAHSFRFRSPVLRARLGPYRVAHSITVRPSRCRKNDVGDDYCVHDRAQRHAGRCDPRPSQTPSSTHRARHRAECAVIGGRACTRRPLYADDALSVDRRICVRASARLWLCGRAGRNRTSARRDRHASAAVQPRCRGGAAHRCHRSAASAMVVARSIAGKRQPTAGHGPSFDSALIYGIGTVTAYWCFERSLGWIL